MEIKEPFQGKEVTKWRYENQNETTTKKKKKREKIGETK